MKIQLTFEDPLLVSQGIKPDRLAVRLNKDLFLMPLRFANANTVKDEDEEPFFLAYKSLPRMVRSEAELEVIESTAQTAKSVVIATVVVPVVLGVGLKGLMSKMQAMITTY